MENKAQIKGVLVGRDQFGKITTWKEAEVENMFELAEAFDLFEKSNTAQIKTVLVDMKEELAFWRKVY